MKTNAQIWGNIMIVVLIGAIISVGIGLAVVPLTINLRPLHFVGGVDL